MMAVLLCLVRWKASWTQSCENFSLCSQSQRALSDTYSRLLGGNKDEGTDEAGTVIDSVVTL